MGDKNMAGGVPKISHPDQLCRACLAAKQTRAPFPHATQWRAGKVLDLVHVDLCGPITPSTAGGNKYFMLLVDDSTRWSYVFMVKTKDQALEAFCKYKAEVENITGERIKVLRSDRGGEFLSSVFKDVCESAGIQRHLTAPYTPQQNSVVERKNRTVMEMARSLLKSMKLPGKFWGEAVRHSVYLLNRLPTKALVNKTLFESWKGIKPHLGHLRVFGCVAHVKSVGPHLKKLEDRSHPMIYLGVEEGSKAHRLFDPNQQKLVVSRDVKFEEAVSWEWSGRTSAVEPMEFVVENDLGEFGGVQGGASQVQSVSEDNSSSQDENMHRNPGGGGVLSDGEQYTISGAADAAPASLVTPAVSSAVQLQNDDGQSGTGGLDMSNSSADEPRHFRSLNEIYQETSEVECNSESDIEALLAEMEEPTCYREAANQIEWVDAMNKEVQSIEKIRHGN
jgi:hypothetical protein